MPASRTQRGRKHDLKIHEALVAGHTPIQVAAQFEMAVEAVRAADSRARAEQRALGPTEEARERLLVLSRVIAEQSMQAWQRSILEGEESLKISSGEAGSGRKAERITHKKPGDTRYLDRALRALEQEARLRRLDELPLAASKAEHPSKRQQRAMKHPRYPEYLTLQDLVFSKDPDDSSAPQSQT